MAGVLDPPYRIMLMYAPADAGSHIGKGGGVGVEVGRGTSKVCGERGVHSRRAWLHAAQETGLHVQQLVCYS